MDNIDRQLIANFLAGDEKSFETLVKGYLPAVHNFLRQMISDQAVLDDLAQETFIKAWKNLRRFDAEKKFKTWLFTIAKNTAFDFFRKKKTIPFSDFTDEEGYNFLENMPEDKILPDEILARADPSASFEKKMQELPTIYRTLLTLRYKEDFSLLEIAEILQLPYNTVKSRHKRGLFKLKEIIEKDNAPY